MTPPDTETFASWSAFILGVVALLAALIPRAFGGVADTARRARKHRQNKDDARVVDLTQDINYLRKRIDDLVTDYEHMWQLIHAHRPWDHEMVSRLRELHPTAVIPLPPPLLPRGSIAQQVRTAVVAEEAKAVLDGLQAKADERGPNGHPGTEG